VQFLPGVGPNRAKALEQLGIRTAGDLLQHFPARYERREQRTIENLDEGMTATIIGQLTAVRFQFGRRGRSVTATLTDNTGRCSLTWFNAGWMRDKLQPGVNVRVTGKVSEYRRLPQFANPKIEFLDEDAQPVDESADLEFDAVYPACAAISSRAVAKLIETALPRLLPLVSEWHDDSFLAARKLMARRTAIEAIHRPISDTQTEPARRRLAYDEFIQLQMATSLARRARRAGTAPAIAVSDEVDRRIRARFPFAFTAAQDRAVTAIRNDLAQPRPMNRLLQGDVGCGKTAVALYAALAAIAGKQQAAIMAPTELLAEQHHREVTRRLAGSRVRIGYLRGGIGAKQRRELIADIAAGTLDLVIGTQALIEPDVVFDRLALVIVDEQHRFGVRQRAVIRSKGATPHYLVMSATPIPRTLAMTVFGDLDVTTIDALPPGRPKRTTRLLRPGEHEKAWSFVNERLTAGEQAYVVYPLVAESETMDLRAAETEHERLASTAFRDRRVGLLHGRMSADARQSVMAEFSAGKIDVLVSTTVIEVGIDVPNATVMVIEHAERFGLSQLHQLRGRIGRGGKAGHCLLLTASNGGPALERLRVMTATDDGFRIAEEDLRLRGPGEILGTRQHGLPEFRAADLLKDGDLLRMAQRDAEELLASDPQQKRNNAAALQKIVQTRFGSCLGFVDAG